VVRGRTSATDILTIPAGQPDDELRLVTPGDRRHGVSRVVITSFGHTLAASTSTRTPPAASTEQGAGADDLMGPPEQLEAPTRSRNNMFRRYGRTITQFTKMDRRRS